MKKIKESISSNSKQNKKILFKKLKKIGLILGILVSLITIYIFFFKKKDVSLRNTVNNSPVIINNTINSNSVTKYNNTIKEIAPKKTIPNSLYYSINIVNNLKLIKTIERSSNIKIRSNSSNKIKITYTGQIKLLSKDTNVYIYTGGNIKILINNYICYNYKDLKIKSMRPNSIESINSNIQKNIEAIVDLNLNTFSNKITQCIKN
ncbi:hypothetical protein [Tenacibaculum halocynthiae]|uniref:hypothetical protein n=1 Tax=Tenacibaculum halocynthiae TaxID=1254437 RepID=UPI003893CE4B